MYTPLLSASSGRSERFARALILALSAVVLFALLPFMSGLLGAVMLAVIVRPVCERLAHVIGRRPAAALTAAATVLLLLVPGAVLITSLVAQAPDTIRLVTQSAALRRLAALQVAGMDLGLLTAQATNALVAWASRQAVALFGGLTLATFNIFVALVGLYYLLAEVSGVWQSARVLLPFSPATVGHLAERFRLTTESLLIGILFTAVAQGCVVGGAFALVGLPKPGFWAFVTACVSVLPVLGTSLVWLPGAFVLALDHRYAAALALAAIGIVVASNVDNIIRPLVYRRVSRIHPMVTLVGAFGGMRLFGFAGLLIGPLGIAYLLDLVAAYRLEYGDRAAVAAQPPPVLAGH